MSSKANSKVKTFRLTLRLRTTWRQQSKVFGAHASADSRVTTSKKYRSYQQNTAENTKKLSKRRCGRDSGFTNYSVQKQLLRAAYRSSLSTQCNRFPRKSGPSSLHWRICFTATAAEPAVLARVPKPGKMTSYLLTPTMRFHFKRFCGTDVDKSQAQKVSSGRVDGRSVWDQVHPKPTIQVLLIVYPCKEVMVHEFSATQSLMENQKKIQQLRTKTTLLQLGYTYADKSFRLSLRRLCCKL